MQEFLRKYMLDIVLGIIGIVANLILGLFNPFDNFGNAFWSVNIWTGTIIIPHNTIHCDLCLATISLSQVRWSKIKVRINFRKIEITIAALNILADGAAVVDSPYGASEIAHSFNSSIGKSNGTGQDFGKVINAFRFHWWMKYFPGIELHLSDSPYINLQMESSSKVFLMTKEVKFDSNLIFDNTIQSTRFELNLITSTVVLGVADDNSDSQVDCMYTMEIFENNNFHNFALYLKLSSGVVSICWQPTPVGASATTIQNTVIGIELGNVVCYFDILQTSLLCQIVHDLSSILDVNTSAYGNTFQRYRRSCQLSQAYFFAHLDRRAAMSTYGHPSHQENHVNLIPSDEEANTSGANSIPLFSTKFHCKISEIDVQCNVCKLSPVEPLERRGKQRTLRRPKTVIQCNRDHYSHIISVFALTEFSISLLLDCDVTLGKYSIAIDTTLAAITCCKNATQSIPSETHSGVPIATLCSSYSIPFASIANSFDAASSNYSTGTLVANIAPVNLCIDIAMISQVLCFICELQSTMKAVAIPRVFLPNTGLEPGPVSVANILLGAECVHWDSFSVTLFACDINFTDSDHQFSKYHNSFLAVSLRNIVVNCLTQTSNPEPNNDESPYMEIDIDGVEYCFEDCANTEVTVQNLVPFNIFAISCGQLTMRNVCYDDVVEYQPNVPWKYCLVDNILGVNQSNIVIVNGITIEVASQIVGNINALTDGDDSIEAAFNMLSVGDSSNDTGLAVKWKDKIDNYRNSAVPHIQSTCSVIVESIRIDLDQYDASAIAVLSHALSAATAAPIRSIQLLPFEFVNCSSLQSTSPIVVVTTIVLQEIDCAITWKTNLGEVEDMISIKFPSKLQLETISVGNTIGAFDVSLTDDIWITRAHQNNLDKATIDIKCPASHRIYSSIRFPSTIWQSTSMNEVVPKAIVLFTNFSKLSLKKLFAKLDHDSLNVLFRIRGRCGAEGSNIRAITYALGVSNITSCAIPTLQAFDYRKDYDRSSNPSEIFPQPRVRQQSGSGVMLVTHKPNSIFLVDLSSVVLEFEQMREPVVSLSLSNFTMGSIAFGPNLNQVCGSLTQLRILDKLLPTSIHAYVIHSIDTQAGMTNKIEFQMSSLHGECSLLDCRAAFLRVTYLQRPVMAYVMYFRDYFFPSFWNAYNFEHEEWALSNGYEISNVPNVASAGRKPFGQFRFTTELINCEAHIPTNACGSDCLTAIFPRLRLFKSANELNNVYCMGPNLLHGLWLSEFDHILSMAGMKSKNGRRLSTSNAVSKLSGFSGWNLLDYVHLLQAPESEFREVKLFKLDADCENATICSWCNKNEVGSRININCFITFGPVPPAPDAMYAEVFKSMGFVPHPTNNKNMVVVDISTDEVDWTISQGQYMAIVYLIQQNIPEIQLVVKDVNAQPVNKIVHLESNVFGKYSMERRLPMINTVPIHIKSGRLTAVDNEPEYYDLLSRLLSARNPDNGYLGDDERFPLWSHHHVHRAALFSGCNMDDESYWSSITRRHRKPMRNERKPFSFEEPTMSAVDHATIIRIYFKRLEVDFFRLHYGGGAGIDVSAGTFIIVSSKFDAVSNNTADENDAASVTSIDLDEIQPETIIFAPKTLPQLRKSLAASSSGYKQTRTHRSGSRYRMNREQSTITRPSVSASKAAYEFSGGDDDPAIVDQDGNYGDADEDYFTPDEYAESDNEFDFDEARGFDSRKQYNDGEDEAAQEIVNCRVTFNPVAGIRSPSIENDSDDESTGPDFSWHGDPLIARGAEGINIGSYVPQIRYRQQGLANLRRCIVDITESVIVTHIRPIMAAISYFVDPITLNDLRGQALMAKDGDPPYDFKAGLDVEVHTKSTVIAVPKLSNEEAMSVLCIQSDLDYTHAFRGFKNAGPAKVTVNIDLAMYGVFIAPVHEIRVTGSESLVEPCLIHFGSDWQVYPTEATQQAHFNALEPHMSIHCLPKKISKTSDPVATRLMAIKIASISTDDDAISRDSDFRRTMVSVNDSAEGEIVQILKLKCSLKDVVFVAAASEQVKQSWLCRRQQNPLPQRYSFFFEGDNAFRDISHLNRPTFQSVYIPFEGKLIQGDQDIVVNCCNLEIILKNNTYNLKIAKMEFSDFNLSYSKAFDRLHMAIGLTLSAWTFNENADTWEPIIESTGGSCIAATDTSLNVMTGAAANAVAIPPVRYDVFCNPVCINTPESTTVSLIRKFSLADVITTSSIHLPPYRVINELGIPVSCSLSIGANQLYESEVSVGNFLPIERRDIAKASMSNRKHHRQRGAAAVASSHISDNDHKLGLTFTMDLETFSSKEPLPIDREGIFAYDMKPIVAKQKSRSILRLPSFSLGSVNPDESPVPSASSSSDSSVVVNTSGGTTIISNTNVNNLGKVTKQQTMRVGYNFPYTLVSMRIKDDGGRELVLRSCLSLKNLSNRHMFISIRRGGTVAETSLTPGTEWNVPIQLAHPKSSLFIRRNAKSPWFEVSGALGSLILQGVWGAPTKLKAEAVSCPPDISLNGCKEMNWVLLLKPEVRDNKGGFGNALGSRTFIPVKYPSKDVQKLKGESAEFLSGASGNGTPGERLESSENLKAFDEIYNLGFSGSSQRTIIAQPMCIHLIAPLQLCNLLSQPLMYRIADNEGLVVAEGVLLQGEVVDVHSVYQIFAKRVFISIRVVNYCWSKWTKILSKNNPFPSNEKTFDIPLTSMDLTYQQEDMQFPLLDVILHMREHIVRVSCPIVIRNCTGLQLDISESSALDYYIPHSSQPPIESSVAMKFRAVQDVQAPVKAIISSENVSRTDIKPLTQPAELVAESAEEIDGNNGNAAEESDDEFKDFAEGAAVEPSADFGVAASMLNSSPSRGHNKQYTPLSNIANAAGNTRPINSVVSLSIHLPYDHMSKIDMVAAPDWTLATVFSKVASKLAVNKQFRNPALYMFFIWEEGSNGPGLVPYSPAIEADMFGTRRSSAPGNSTLSNAAASVANSSSRTGAVVRGQQSHESSNAKDDDDDEADDDDDVPITSLNQDSKQADMINEQLHRVKSTQSSKSFFSGMTGFNFSSAKKDSSAPAMASVVAAASAQASVQKEQMSNEMIPPSMQYGMISYCSLDPLPMSMRVEELKHHRLRICHVVEYRIFEQIHNIKSDAVQKEGIMTMFSRAKLRHRTKFTKYEGDIPFNPKRSLLSFTPSLSIRVAHLTGWSDPMDLLSGNFGSGGDYVSLQGLQYSSSSQDVHYEFGAYAERGKGFNQNILCVSIVPKHIIVFKLTSMMQIRQLLDTDSHRCTTLRPGSIQNYHYPVPRKDKFLQVRRVDSDDANPSNLNELSPKNPWFGEIDISHLGIVFVKLRNPLYIVKVQVEVVGASLIATMAPQDNQWPPYRIDNSSSLTCRFRQSMTPVNTSASSGLYGNRDLSASTSRSKSAPGAASKIANDVMLRSNKFGVAHNEILSDILYHEDSKYIPWDELSPRDSCPFAWDFPASGTKMLSIEFSQGPTWIGVDISLDDVSKARVIALQRPLVGLSNPQAEGMLKYHDGDDFIDAYCILKEEVIYVFRDQTRDELVDVVCLARTMSTNITARGPNNEVTTLARRETVQLASVFKYVEGHAAVFKSISSTLGYLSWSGNTKTDGNVDVNKARILLLLLADGLGVFKTVPKGTKASKDQARERAESVASEGSGNTACSDNSQAKSAGSGSSGVNSLVRQSAAAKDDNNVFSLDHPDEIGAPPKLSRRSMLKILSEGTEDQPDEEKQNIIEEKSGFHSDSEPDDVDRDDSTSEDVLGRDEDDDDDADAAYEKESGSSLREQLQLGVPVDQLLEYISAFTFEMFDIVHVLETIGEVSDKQAGGQLCYQLISRGILVVSTADDQTPSTLQGMSTPPAEIELPEKRAPIPLGTIISVNTDQTAGNVNTTGEPLMAISAKVVTTTTSPNQFEGYDDCEHSVHSSTSSDEEPTKPTAIASRISMIGIPGPELKATTEPALNLTMRTKLTFGMPSLFAELAALAAADNEMWSSARGRMTLRAGMDENEINGFSIYRGDATDPVHFMCGSESEFLGWIQSCRQNAEQVWGKFVSSLPPQRVSNNFDHVQRADVNIAADDAPPLKFTAGDISVDSFKLKLNLKVRADGPTKVLEITELNSTIETRIRSIVLSSNTNTLNAIPEENSSDDEQAVDGQEDSTASVNANESNDGVAADTSAKPTILPIAKAISSKSPAKTPQEMELERERQQLIVEQQHALFVSVKVESVSVSLIDSEPAEVIFLSLRDIQMSVERTYHKLTIAATVHNLQVSNQLLKPAFPVALHPRKVSAALAGSGGNNRLRLPGLHHGAQDEFPALHLFCQQKLYHVKLPNPSEVKPVRGDSTTKNIGVYVPTAANTDEAVMKVAESKLLYFEMATVWLAPMELDIDEELVIRLMRFVNVIRTSFRKPDMGSLSRLREEILSIQHQGTKSWGTMDPASISNGFMQLLEASKMPYAEFNPLGDTSSHLYFSLLQLHPLDIVMNLHPSPTFPITSSEMAIVSLISQVDGARLCLNALITEHAFGSISIITDIIIKHYKASLWRQFHKLIGSADIVEGSVGLVANLGSGVYDLFYEPIEGLLDENGSFLNGLSKGGRSLASRTIGGTSGFTSKITGGIGKGVSYLTMDSDFYRNRASRRLNKTTTMSEGLYVGTKELGKNIVEGFSGIVVSPYRGWEEGGGYGFGVGIAKGILGVALKPAVGVFDLASRATEGIRHTAFGAEIGSFDKSAVTRSRIPRSFGRLNVLIPYNNEAAAAQYLSDKLVAFNRDTRVLIVHHQHVIRTLNVVGNDTHPMKGRTPDADDSDSDNEQEIESKVELSVPGPPTDFAGQVGVPDEDDIDTSGKDTSRGLSGDDNLSPTPVSSPGSPVFQPPDPMTLRQSEALAKLRTSAVKNSNAIAGFTSDKRPSITMVKDEGSVDFRKLTEAWGMTTGNSYVALISAYRITLTEIRSERDSKNIDFRFIWSCPASCVDQLFGDTRGDLVISVGSSVAITGAWNSSYPVVLDFFAQDFLLFQSLLEQTIGPRLARLQPLAPSGGLIQRDLYKRYSTGLKSILLSPTKHTFQLFGYVLYEYTVITKKKDGVNSTQASGGTPASSTSLGEDEDPKKKEQKNDDPITADVGRIFGRTTPALRRGSVAVEPPRSAVGDTATNAYSTTGTPEGVLTYVYPLVDMVLLGPYKEDNGRYSLSLSRKDGSRMRVLKRENPEDHIFEHHKSMLTIIFPDSKSAWKWRHSVESHIVRTPKDILPTGPLIPDKKKTILGSIAGSVIGRVEGDEPIANSILGMLVIPTAGLPPVAVEAMKVEIAKTLLVSRR